MPKITCHISRSLQKILEEQSKIKGESISHLVSMALARSFEIPHHTFFQVSTTGALVQGIYERAVSSKYLLNYGNFGIGTFENLDGEMVVLDGAIYQARSDGKVSKVTEEVGTPFAIVLFFEPDLDEIIETTTSLADVRKVCDNFRDSDNIFYAFRIDGKFDHIHTRAMKATVEGVPLAEASSVQPEFEFNNISGSLVGIWAPQFSSAFNVAGYHFHFLSEDRTKGGHLLECSGTKLRVRMERMNDFHLSLPESQEFLRADLSKDSSKDIAYAEQIHDKGNADGERTK